VTMDCSAGEQDPADMVKGEADSAAGRGVGSITSTPCMYHHTSAHVHTHTDGICFFSPWSLALSYIKPFNNLATAIPLNHLNGTAA
jgi:hypothetical protein